MKYNLTEFLKYLYVGSGSIRAVAAPDYTSVNVNINIIEPKYTSTTSAEERLSALQNCKLSVYKYFLKTNTAGWKKGNAYILVVNVSSNNLTSCNFFVDYKPSFVVDNTDNTYSCGYVFDHSMSVQQYSILKTLVSLFTDGSIVYSFYCPGTLNLKTGQRVQLLSLNNDVYYNLGAFTSDLLIRKEYSPSYLFDKTEKKIIKPADPYVLLDGKRYITLKSYLEWEYNYPRLICNCAASLYSESFSSPSKKSMEKKAKKDRRLKNQIQKRNGDLYNLFRVTNYCLAKQQLDDALYLVAAGKVISYRYAGMPKDDIYDYVLFEINELNEKFKFPLSDIRIRGIVKSAISKPNLFSYEDVGQKLPMYLLPDPYIIYDPIKRKQAFLDEKKKERKKVSAAKMKEWKKEFLAAVSICDNVTEISRFVGCTRNTAYKYIRMWQKDILKLKYKPERVVNYIKRFMKQRVDMVSAGANSVNGFVKSTNQTVTLCPAVLSSPDPATALCPARLTC